jgi:hypothetical protein
VVNHFKSKGSDCDSVIDPGTLEELWSDPDAGDGQGNCNLTRVAQAEALLEFAADLQESTNDDDVLIIGDLNSYAMEDPVAALEDAEYTNLLAAAEGVTAYSYVFDGRLGNLDHALGSTSIVAQVTGTAAWHINSDEPSLLDYDTSFKQDPQDALYEPNAFRASDHDPVVVGLELGSFDVVAVPDMLWPPNHKYRRIAFEDGTGAPLTVEVLSATSSEDDCCYDEDDLPDDIVVTGGATLDLRAERYTRPGRTYTVEVYAWNGAGSARIATVTVVVPHDRRGMRIE